MPIAEDQSRDTGRSITDDAGRVVARFLEQQRDGKRFADLLELADGVAVHDAVPLLQKELTGWQLAATAPVGNALIAAGGVPRRHAHVMSRDLVRDPAPGAWLEARAPDGYQLTPVDRAAADLGDAVRAAYPANHPDFANVADRESLEEELGQLMDGSAMGPLLRCSGLAVREDGSVAGAVLVNGSSGEPPFGGPWISQIFRHPDDRGLGEPLLHRALAIATRDGLPAVGLAVTHDNANATALYARNGFADLLESVGVAL
jgi:hypothetical protein